MCRAESVVLVARIRIAFGWAISLTAFCMTVAASGCSYVVVRDNGSFTASTPSHGTLHLHGLTPTSVTLGKPIPMP